MGPTVVVLPEPSFWHFFIGWSVGVAIVTSLYNAAIGVLGMNAVQPNWRKWPKGIWLAFGLGIALAVCIGVQTANQLQEADRDKRTADSRYVGENDRLKAVQDQQKSTSDELNGKLRDLSDRSTKLQTVLDSLGSAAHVPAGTSVDNLVKAITDKLPKAENKAVATGTRNAVANTAAGGQTVQSTGDCSPNVTGTGASATADCSKHFKEPPHTETGIYQNGTKVGDGTAVAWNPDLHTIRFSQVQTNQAFYGDRSYVLDFQTYHLSCMFPQNFTGMTFGGTALSGAYANVECVILSRDKK
jgi:hypothetical protein